VLPRLLYRLRAEASQHIQNTLSNRSPVLVEYEKIRPNYKCEHNPERVHRSSWTEQEVAAAVRGNRFSSRRSGSEVGL